MTRKRIPNYHIKEAQQAKREHQQTTRENQKNDE